MLLHGVGPCSRAQRNSIVLKYTNQGWSHTQLETPSGHSVLVRSEARAKRKIRILELRTTKSYTTRVTTYVKSCQTLLTGSPNNWALGGHSMHCVPARTRRLPRDPTRLCGAWYSQSTLDLRECSRRRAIIKVIVRSCAPNLCEQIRPILTSTVCFRTYRNVVTSRRPSRAK